MHPSMRPTAYDFTVYDARHNREHEYTAGKGWTVRVVGKSGSVPKHPMKNKEFSAPDPHEWRRGEVEMPACPAVEAQLQSEWGRGEVEMPACPAVEAQLKSEAASVQEPVIVPAESPQAANPQPAPAPKMVPVLLPAGVVTQMKQYFDMLHAHLTSPGASDVAVATPGVVPPPAKSVPAATPVVVAPPAKMRTPVAVPPPSVPVATPVVVPPPAKMSVDVETPVAVPPKMSVAVETPVAVPPKMSVAVATPVAVPPPAKMKCASPASAQRACAGHCGTASSSTKATGKQGTVQIGLAPPPPPSVPKPPCPPKPPSVPEPPLPPKPRSVPEPQFPPKPRSVPEPPFPPKPRSVPEPPLAPHPKPEMMADATALKPGAAAADGARPVKVKAMPKRPITPQKARPVKRTPRPPDYPPPEKLLRRRAGIQSAPWRQDAGKEAEIHNYSSDSAGMAVGAVKEECREDEFMAGAVKEECGEDEFMADGAVKEECDEEYEIVQLEPEPGEANVEPFENADWGL